jgi:N-acetylglutamate synthase-like GNAT family acetyltransferase
MKIRRYKDGDIEGIVKFIDNIMREFGESFDSHLDRDLLDISQYYGNKGAFWVMMDGKKIVGTIAFIRLTDEVCKFRRFYIDKEFREQGWGSKLFDIRLKFAKKMGYKEAWLCTSAHHKKIIEFYKGKGGVISKKKLFPVKRAHMFFIIKI